MDDDLEPGAERGASPTQRLVQLLEALAAAGAGRRTLQALTEDTGLPKPSLHRLLSQLEGGQVLRRTADGRAFGAGPRLRQLAASLLLNAGVPGARHALLQQLVARIGESCNLSALDGDAVVWLDRVASPAPLRIDLQPGLRVPLHASASGKLFLASATPAQRQRLLPMPLPRFTAATLTDPAALEQALARVRRDGHAIEREEFLEGLTCVAVPVAPPGVRPRLALAVQAPTLRLDPARAEALLPALRETAQALARLEATALAGGDLPPLPLHLPTETAETP